MLTKDEQLKLTELMNSNDDFAYFINKCQDNCKVLASQISHELRNPLTLIKSTAQLIESNNPEVKEIKYWNNLVEDIGELEILLTELTIYNNSNMIIKHNQDLILLIKSVISTFKPMAELTGINLSFNVSEEAIPYYSNFLLDQVKFRQVFNNLIRNAFDATQKGDYIAVECYVNAPTHLKILVHNNGKMIPSEELPYIFDPFVTFKSGGSGLGLAIVSNIITAHEGYIEVQSNEDNTCFSIYLPIV